MDSEQEKEFIRIIQDKNHPLHKAIFEKYDLAHTGQFSSIEGSEVWGAQLEMHNQGTNYIKTYKP